jgi:hypothetical protein
MSMLKDDESGTTSLVSSIEHHVYAVKKHEGASTGLQFLPLSVFCHFRFENRSFSDVEVTTEWPWTNISADNVKSSIVYISALAMQYKYYETI